MSKKIKIFLIAGEISGDRLGAKLMQAFKRKLKNKKIEFCGVGGDKMIAEKLKLTSHINRMSIMGFVEVMPHIMKMLSLIKSTAKAIEGFKPDLLIMIDSWGFCSRVVRRLKCIDKMKLIHYVSPTIWAYRRGRIKDIERLYKLVLSIFPFEKKHYEGTKVNCKYIGHPMMEDFLKRKDGSEFRKDHGITNKEKIIGVMLGSRIGEVRRHLSIFIEAVALFLSKLPDKDKFFVVFPAVSAEVVKMILSYNKDRKFSSIVVNMAEFPESKRISMFKAFDMALIKSGTASLELAFAGVPMVVAYKVNKLSEWIAKYIFGLHKRIKYASMVNILLNKLVIEEFLQDRCNSKDILEGLLKLADSSYRKKQLSNYNKVAKMLSVKKRLPSDIAVENILKLGCS